MRRKYIVDAKFQWTVVAYTFFISLLTSAVHVTVNELYVIDKLQNLTSLDVIRVVGPRTAIFLLAGFFYGCVFCIGVLFSNRLAGALYRLRRHMLEVANGKRSGPIHFRQDDYFTDLNHAYNNLIESLPPDRKIAKPARSGQDGFSLMEMVMVIAIAGVVIAMSAVLYLGNMRDFLSFNQDISNLQGILMAGRNAAMNMNECTKVTVANAQTVTVTAYPVAAPCVGPLPAPNMLMSQTFASTSQVSNFSIGTTLTFKPGGGTMSPGPVTMTLTGQSATIVYTIYPAIGQVRHL